MWHQSANNDQVDGAASKEKQIEDTQADSGFLSASNLLSSQISVDYDIDGPSTDDAEVAPEPPAISESGLKRGMEHLKQTLQKHVVTDNELDSGIIDVKTEDLISLESEIDKVNNEEEEPPKNENISPWQLYFAQDNDGDTQLHLAVIQEFEEAANYLIELAPHAWLLDIQNDDWDTVLHLAVLTKQAKIVRKLILAGCNPSIRNFQGDTPLHIACDMGTFDCVKALTNPLTPHERSTLGDKRPSTSTQDLQMRNYEGQMVLHLAAKKGYIDIVRHLIRMGADVNAYEALSGCTALHLAISRQFNELAMILVRDCRAKIDSKMYSGRTAYGLARRLNQLLAAELHKFGSKWSEMLNFSSDSDTEPEDDEDEEEDDDDEDNDEKKKVCEMIEKMKIVVDPRHVS